MAQRAAGPGTGRRRRGGGIGTAKLVAIALGIGVLCMGTLTAKAVISSTSCTNRPVLVNVAASPDIEPAVADVANSFNKQNVTTAGRCVQVQVNSADSGAEAAQIDGQARTQDAVNAWIPDSSLWVDVAQHYPVGAQIVQQGGRSVARSPLMLVTSNAVAHETGIFSVPPSWNVLLPTAYGGPPAALHLTVDLPDPSSSAAGLSSLVEVSRELSGNTTKVATFAHSVQLTESFDSAATLGQFVQTTQPPDGHPVVTVASEQAVLAYDKQAPSAPLAAQYATSPAKTLATPELDFPYVLTTSQSVTRQAATMFGNYLQTKYAQSLMRYFGFRSANGLPDMMPSSDGLAAQPLQLASAPSPTEADASMQVWQKLGLGSRDLVIDDVSPPMGAPSGLPGLSIQKMVSETAIAGLGFFPDSTQMGVWEAGASSSLSQPYVKLVSIGPLDANYSLITRKAYIQRVTAELTTSQTGTLALYDTILDGYTTLTKTYLPNYSNALILLTSGDDTATGDMKLTSLLTQLQQLYNPNKKVGIFILMFGNQGNLAAMEQIANATHGLAVKITNPAQIGQVFFEGISKRMSNS